jgi:hypothetical protein
VIEPARAYRRVGFRRAPHAAGRIAMQQRRVTPGPDAPGNVTAPGSTDDQLGSPAMPFSLPAPSHVGSASENMTASG